MASNIIKKLALAASRAFPVAASVATATVLGWSNPVQAASFNFSFVASNDAAYSPYTVLGSFSYDHTLYSGTISKNQVDSFNISFIKDGEIQQQNSTLSSLFEFEFDTASISIKNMHTGAFYIYGMPSTVPNGSLSFQTYKDNETACSGLVWEKTSDTGAFATGRCDSGSEVVVTPSEPLSQPVPEPASTMSLLVVGAFGAGLQLKRTKKIA